MIKEKIKYDAISLEKQKKWLQISYDECKNIGIKAEYSIDEFGKFETLCSRFARSIDFLVRKFFRTLDAYEFETQGTLIDVVNRAEKRGLIQSADELHVMKDLRNSITHEYLDDELIKTFDETLEYSDKLLDIIKNTLKYTKDIS